MLLGERAKFDELGGSRQAGLARSHLPCLGLRASKMRGPPIGWLVLAARCCLANYNRERQSARLFLGTVGSFSGCQRLA
jgi:hypothetical protein